MTIVAFFVGMIAGITMMAFGVALMVVTSDADDREEKSWKGEEDGGQDENV